MTAPILNQEEPEKDGPALQRSVRGFGGIFLSDLLLFSFKREIM